MEYVYGKNIMKRIMEWFAKTNTARRVAFCDKLYFKFICLDVHMFCLSHLSISNVDPKQVSKNISKTLRKIEKIKARHARFKPWFMGKLKMPK